MVNSLETFELSLWSGQGRSPTFLSWVCLSQSIYSTILPQTLILNPFSQSIYRTFLHRRWHFYFTKSLWSHILHFSVCMGLSYLLIEYLFQVALHLNMPQINYLRSNSWCLSQCWLLCHIELNYFLIFCDHYSTGLSGYRDFCNLAHDSGDISKGPTVSGIVNFTATSHMFCLFEYELGLITST